MINFYSRVFGDLFGPLLFLLTIIVGVIGIIVLFINYEKIMDFIRRYNRHIAAYAAILLVFMIVGRLVWAIVPHTKIIEKTTPIYVANPGTNQYVVAMVVSGENKEILEIKQFTAHSGDEAFGLMYGYAIQQLHPGYKCAMWTLLQTQ